MEINDVVQIDNTLLSWYSRIGVSDPVMLGLAGKQLMVVSVSPGVQMCTVRDPNGLTRTVSATCLVRV